MAQNASVQDYSSGIYKTSYGITHDTEVAPGAVGTSGNDNFPQLHSGDAVIGEIHNHPSTINGTGLPSFPGNSFDGKSSDYEVFMYYYNYDQQNVSAIGGGALFHLYIVAGDGSIYEYNINNIEAAQNGVLGNLVDPKTICPGANK